MNKRTEKSAAKPDDERENIFMPVIEMAWKQVERALKIAHSSEYLSFGLNLY